MTLTPSAFASPLRNTALILSLVSLTACAGGGAAHVPIIDGPITAEYEADLSECQQLAETRRYDNPEVQTDALIGAGVGGLIGLAESRNDDVGDFLAGAIIGGLLSGGATALETRHQRKEIVLNCMAGRGYRVLE